MITVGVDRYSTFGPKKHMSATVPDMEIHIASDVIWIWNEEMNGKSFN